MSGRFGTQQMITGNIQTQNTTKIQNTYKKNTELYYSVSNNQAMFKCKTDRGRFTALEILVYAKVRNPPHMGSKQRSLDVSPMY